MRGKLVNLFLAISLVLCVGVVGLWIDSYFAGLTLAVEREWNDARGDYRRLSWYQSSGRGDWQIVALKQRESQRKASGSQPTWQTIRRRQSPAYEQFDGYYITKGWKKFGFGYAQYDGGFGQDVLVLGIPFWSLFVLTALPQAAWVSRWRRRRKLSRAGLCVQCGYDLRATPDRCPECGMKPKSTPSP